MSALENPALGERSILLVAKANTNSPKLAIEEMEDD
jgi:hypothetical protein